mmetsp:Transcript_3849/g.7930  ORF Transcript_3849/g.7930 Transcript_3849/m.7930 type:complete len:210 (+) Transcript_3849:241-870(+)
MRPAAPAATSSAQVKMKRCWMPVPDAWSPCPTRVAASAPTRRRYGRRGNASGATRGRNRSVTPSAAAPTRAARGAGSTGAGRNRKTSSACSRRLTPLAAKPSTSRTSRRRKTSWNGALPPSTSSWSARGQRERSTRCRRRRAGVPALARGGQRPGRRPSASRSAPCATASARIGTTSRPTPQPRASSARSSPWQARRSAPSQGSPRIST